MKSRKDVWRGEIGSVELETVTLLSRDPKCSTITDTFSVMLDSAPAAYPYIVFREMIDSGW